jgi:hypothetical protein
LQGLANDIVYGLTADSKGNMWIATRGGGASKYDGTSFFNYDRKMDCQVIPSSKLQKTRKGKFGLQLAIMASAGTMDHPLPTSPRMMV